jgi:type III secretory pathway component EscS
MMNKEAVFNRLEEFVTIFFLSAGPVLGAAIAVGWLVGLILGLFAVLTR